LKDLPDTEPTATRFKFDVALHEDGVCDGIPVIALLEDTIVEVERVVVGFLPHLS
jgi:hypothetical protein